MKKILSIILISLISTCCYGNNTTQSDKEKAEEIHLDTGTSYKKYKLNQPDFNNPKELYNNDDDDSMPMEFITNPLQLLKQYQADKY